MHPALIKAEILAIDLHGVIDFAPKFFAAFMNLSIRADKKVYVVSGPPKEQIEKELSALDIGRHYNYSEIYSVVDDLKYRGVKMWQDDRGTWWSDEKNWWAAKGAICKDLKADVMLDDHIEFQAGFPEEHPTEFILFNYYSQEHFKMLGID